MYSTLLKGDKETAAQCLTNIIRLRDFMLTLDLMPAHSAAMNLLGCEGFLTRITAHPTPARPTAKWKRK